MGASYVVAATAWAHHLSDQAFRVLVKMAVTALDTATEDQAAGEFFGSTDLLWPMFRGSGSQASKMRDMRRAIQELVLIGAIVPVNHTRKGVRQKYRLTLLDPGVSVPEAWDGARRKRGAGGTWLPKKQDGDELPEGSSAPISEGHWTPNTEGSSAPEVRGPVPTLRNQEEPPQELGEEYMADLGEPVHGDAPQTQPQDEDQPLVHPSTADKINHEAPVVDLTEPPTTPTREQPRCPAGGDDSCRMGYIKIPGQPGNHRCPHCNPTRDKPRWVP